MINSDLRDFVDFDQNIPNSNSGLGIYDIAIIQDNQHNDVRKILSEIVGEEQKFVLNPPPKDYEPATPDTPATPERENSKLRITENVATGIDSEKN